MQYFTQKLTLEHIHTDGGRIIFHHSVDNHPFQTEIYYEGVDFATLKKSYGDMFIDRLIFHIGFIEGMKYCSLFPRFYDVSRYSSFMNNALIDLFYLLYKNIFAQHRWENNNLSYTGPQIICDETISIDSIGEIQTGNVEVLFSCGGGKDSLVSMKLLERASIPYAISQYSHSIYGDAEKQHMLIDDLVHCCHPLRQSRIYIRDNFLGSSVLQDHFAGKIKTLCAPETPCGVFETLPLMLAYGYTYSCVGHERDADTGSFPEGDAQEINHQWGKSYKAEIALNSYIQKHLVKNFTFFSILKPLYDFLIFQLLRKDQQYITQIHSCNIEKPWCKRCPKCLYVWLGCLAYLDDQNIFEENLFDVAEVEEIFLQMMGLQGFKPFECIGEIDGVRLALHQCVKKGLTGNILTIFKQEIVPYTDFSLLLKKYNTIYSTDHAIPTPFVDRIWSQLRTAQVVEKDF